MRLRSRAGLVYDKPAEQAAVATNEAAEETNAVTTAESSDNRVKNNRQGNLVLMVKNTHNR